MLVTTSKQNGPIFLKKLFLNLQINYFSSLSWPRPVFILNTPHLIITFETLLLCSRTFSSSAFIIVLLGVIERVTLYVLPNRNKFENYFQWLGTARLYFLCSCITLFQHECVLLEGKVVYIVTLADDESGQYISLVTDKPTNNGCYGWRGRIPRIIAIPAY